MVKLVIYDLLIDPARDRPACKKLLKLYLHFTTALPDQVSGELVGTCICPCLLYTSDAADELDGVDLGGRRSI